MNVFHITWRPSGGRGEYEYSPVDSDFEGKPIHIRLPVEGASVNLVTDTILSRNGGKRRIRRGNPNDRAHPSVPNLVAAMMALPRPTRDRDNIVSPSLAEGKWAVGAVNLAIESTPVDPVLVVRPLSLKPRHFESPISFDERMRTLEAESKLSTPFGAKAEAHLELLKAATTTTALEESALSVFREFELENEGLPLLSTPQEINDARAIVAAESDAPAMQSGVEGRKRMAAHAIRERDKELVKRKKDAFRTAHGSLFCECCRLVPADMYGMPLEGLIEAHHKVPLHKCADDEVRITSLDDLVLLCRNCHGALHRFDPMPEIETFRAALLMRPKPI